MQNQAIQTARAARELTVREATPLQQELEMLKKRNQKISSSSWILVKTGDNYWNHWDTACLKSTTWKALKMCILSSVLDKCLRLLGFESAAPCETSCKLRYVALYPALGKESIQNILETLKEEGYGYTEDFGSFSHVSCRRLGRLLPDARWAWLPFMDFRQRPGHRTQVLKRSCMRVKCFIETDAGFNPTPSKTDFAHQNPFANALKTLGTKQPPEKEMGVHIDIRRDGKPLTLLQLDKQYQQWLVQMHEKYDEEVDCGIDEPVFIVNFTNKELHIANNGFQGDAGEAWIICRQIEVSEEDGCLLESANGNPIFDLRKSELVPINVIDSGKIKITPKQTQTEQIDDGIAEDVEEVENDNLITKSFASVEDLEHGKLPPKEILSLPMFKMHQFKGAVNYNYKHLQLATNNFSEENSIGLCNGRCCH
ncbi:unnamed protein product [Lactuca virosa]|uniref:Uncharacterized protein n=1 Tax=Lactuca virosa TaxID=75947 RepID=A0AAU9PCJ0_9ASTR|nr:unnamed protein product [Lactuca virosa]